MKPFALLSAYVFAIGPAFAQSTVLSVDPGYSILDEHLGPEVFTGNETPQIEYLGPPTGSLVDLYSGALREILESQSFQSVIERDEPPIGPVTPEMDEPGSEALSGKNVRVRSVFQDEADFLGDIADGVADGGSCLPTAFFDVASWHNTERLLEALETDEIEQNESLDPNERLTLARLFVAHSLGFGALRIFDNESERNNHQEIMALARLVDGDFDHVPKVLEGQYSCNSHAAIWSFLIAPETIDFDAVRTDAIGRSFLSLPNIMKLRFGPVLIQKFIHFQYVDGVLLIRDALIRSGYERSPERAFIDAELAWSNDDLDTAMPLFRRLLRADIPLSGYAWIRLATAVTSGAVNPTARDLDLGRVISFQYSQHPLRDAINASLVRMLIADDAFDEAFDALIRTHEFKETSVRALKSELAQAILEDGSDYDVVRGVLLGLFASLEKEGSDALRLSAAQRLLQLGMARRALVELRRIGEAARIEHQVELGKALLRTGKTEEAVAILKGIDSPHALSLLGEAFERLGDAEQALFYYTAAGNTEAASHNAIQIERWQDALTGAERASRKKR
ncbi:MAG: hypothetical protein AAGG54_02890 [Pseudomonadota bacterium]